MGIVSVTKIGEGLTIHLPGETAERLNIRQGDEVAIEEKGTILLIRASRPGRQEPLQQFSDSLARLRANARKAGGISSKEVDEAVRKARECG